MESMSFCLRRSAQSLPGKRALNLRTHPAAAATTTCRRFARPRYIHIQQVPSGEPSTVDGNYLPASTGNSSAASPGLLGPQCPDTLATVLTKWDFFYFYFWKMRNSRF